MSFAALIFSGGILIWKYLQTGSLNPLSKINILSDSENDEKNLKSTVSELNKKNAQLFEGFEQKLIHLQGEVDGYKEKNIFELSNEERANIVSNYSKKLEPQLPEEFVKEIKQKLSIEIHKNKLDEILYGIFSNTVKRLNLQKNQLRVRANVNLWFGIAITAVGLYVLWGTVLEINEILYPIEHQSQLVKSATLQKEPTIPPTISTPSKQEMDIPRVIAIFGSRLSLVLFIELFAYFFLQLYKSSLSEIKYFENELTNVETKSAALHAALAEGDDKLKTLVIKNLSQIERNIILEKGQTTVDLERAKSDSTISGEMLKAVSKFFSNKK